MLSPIALACGLRQCWGGWGAKCSIARSRFARAVFDCFVNHGLIAQVFRSESLHLNNHFPDGMLWSGESGDDFFSTIFVLAFPIAKY